MPIWIWACPSRVWSTVKANKDGFTRTQDHGGHRAMRRNADARRATSEDEELTSLPPRRSKEGVAPFVETRKVDEHRGNAVR